MMAARPLSSSSSGTSHLIRDGAFWRSASLSPTRAAGRRPAPRFSASFASTAERERGFAGGSSCNYDYSYARSGSGGLGTAGAAAAGGTLYDVLGMAAGATAQEIKAAYRKLARACHPDAAAGGRGGASADEFMRVHAAYATLSDPGKRAEYDRRLLAAALGRCPASHRSSSSASHFSATSPAPSGSPPSSCFPRRRTWETDQCW